VPVHVPRQELLPKVFETSIFLGRDDLSISWRHWRGVHCHQLPAAVNGSHLEGDGGPVCLFFRGGDIAVYHNEASNSQVG
jgi:hypothetical protein